MPNLRPGEGLGQLEDPILPRVGPEGVPERVHWAFVSMTSSERFRHERPGALAHSGAIVPPVIDCMLENIDHGTTERDPAHVRSLPSGTVTLLFTDIEGSTRLLDELGEDYAALLAEHRRSLRAAFGAYGGIEVDTQGDSFFYAFARATDAVSAANAGQQALSEGRARVRIGIHTGQPTLTEEGYVGMDVHRAARIMAAGHGGQVLVSESTASLVSRKDLLDLGQHRLKDMTAAQHLYQVGEGRFPPLRTLDTSNLPVASSPLLGRDVEVAELVALLQDGARLVTVTGPGGMGKTRLALQVAAELVGRFPDGVFWVPLAEVSDPELVVPEIGKTIGSAGDVETYLRNRQSLLLLDNLERLLDAAPNLSQLLSASSKSRLLVTSRAPLRLSMEHEYPLAPLTQDAAVTLFCDRARAIGRRIGPSTTVAEICRRLDALPLAIELAAARTRLLDPEALLSRLDRRLPMLTGGPGDAPARQRTLRATIEWSYDLLEPGARRLFDRMSVFSGGTTAEGAAAVCDADLDGLGALVEMNLVKAVEGRFTMLETLREFGSERREASGEAYEIARRHASYYADLSERIDDHRRQLGGDPSAEVAEAANIRAAAGWASNVDASLWMRILMGSPWVFAHGSLPMYRRDLETALATRVSDPRLRGRSEEVLAFVTYRQGDYEAAIRAAERSLALGKEAGDSLTIAYARQALAGGYAAVGRFDDARRILMSAVEAAREVGDDHSLALHLLGQSDVALVEGDFELARSLAHEGLATIRPYDDPESEITGATNFAMASLHLGLLDETETTAIESLQVVHARGDITLQAVCVQLLAGVAAYRGDLKRAALLVGLADRLRSEVDLALGPVEQRLQDEILARLASLDATTLAAEQEAGRALSVDKAIGMAPPASVATNAEQS